MKLLLIVHAIAMSASANIITEGRVQIIEGNDLNAAQFAEDTPEELAVQLRQNEAAESVDQFREDEGVGFADRHIEGEAVQFAEQPQEAVQFADQLQDAVQFAEQPQEAVQLSERPVQGESVEEENEIESAALKEDLKAATLQSRQNKPEEFVERAGSVRLGMDLSYLPENGLTVPILARTCTNIICVRICALIGYKSGICVYSDSCRCN